MNIQLGTIVKDKVSGFVGVAENRATFMYGCDRYCVQPRVGEDGKLPDSNMFDEPQLEIVTGEDRVMIPAGEPEKLVDMGQLVIDPIQGIEGTVVGRAVYLNGCSRIMVQPKFVDGKAVAHFWVDEKQVEPKNTFTGKKKITKEPEKRETAYTGGPAPSSSKY